MTDDRDCADSSWTNSLSGTLENHPRSQLPHDPRLFSSLFNHETDNALDGQTTTHAVSNYEEDSLTSGGTIDPKLLLLSPPSPSLRGDDDSCESRCLSSASFEGTCFQPTPSMNSMMTTEVGNSANQSLERTSGKDSSMRTRSKRSRTTVSSQSATSTRARGLSEQGATRSTQSVSENSRQDRKWPHPKLTVPEEQTLVTSVSPLRINGEPVEKILDEAHVLLQQHGMEELSAEIRRRVETLLVEQFKPDTPAFLKLKARLRRKLNHKRLNFQRRLLTFIQRKYSREGKLHAEGVKGQMDKLENDWQDLQDERIRISSAGAS